MFFSSHLFILFFHIFVVSSSPVYLFDGNPFTKQTGDFNTETFHIERSEFSTFVVYPKQVGNYSVFFFVGGFAGVIPSEFYSQILHKIASFGIITIGFDMVNPFDKPEHFFKEYEFLEENLQEYIDKKSGMKGINARMKDYGGVYCHSGGCELAAHLMDMNHDFAKVVVLIDPVGYNLGKELDVNIPTFITGSGKGMNCAPSSMNFHVFYENYKCPKLIWNATEYGHCTPIDELLVKPCSLVCGGGKKSAKKYHDWIVGSLVSMQAVVFRGGKDCVGMNQYLLNQTTFPIPVSQFNMDFDCVQARSTCLV